MGDTNSWGQFSEVETKFDKLPNDAEVNHLFYNIEDLYEQAVKLYAESQKGYGLSSLYISCHIFRKL